MTIMIVAVLLLQAASTPWIGPVEHDDPKTASTNPGPTPTSTRVSTTIGTLWEETDWSDGSNYDAAGWVDTNSTSGDVRLEVEGGETSVDVYVADFGNRRVVRTSMDGSGWTSFGSAGSGEGQFESCSALTFDNGTERLYVCDDANHRLVMTGMDGSGWTSLGAMGTGEREFRNPRGIDLDPATGDLYVADLHNARIVRTRIDGSGWVSNDVDFEVPKGIKYDVGSGLVYVTDIDVVVRMRMDGSGREVFDPEASGVGQVGRLNGIDLDPRTGHLYMTDSELDHVIRTRFDGSGWTTFGTTGAGEGEFARPEGLRFDPATGDVYVADTENDRVVRTGMDGRGWMTLGTLGDGVGEFDYPLDVEIDRTSQPRYATFGHLVSVPHDCRGPARFREMGWNATLPPGTNITLQVRSAATREGLATTEFLGPDGNATTVYTDPGTSIWSGHDGDRWVQYRVVLATTDPTRTPYLHDVSVGYNTPPSILGAQVLPSTGDITTEFNFTLRFDDTDGDLPLVATATVDGEAHPLERHFVQDPHFPGVVMWYSARLPAGEHRYNFSVSDGELWCHTAELVLDVHPGPVHRIVVTPGEASVAADGVLGFQATPYDEAGNALPDPVEWSVSGGGTIDDAGTFEPRKVGTWTVFANTSGVSGEAVVEVVAGALASIEVVPGEATITADEKLAFSASGWDVDGNRVPISPFWGAIGGGTVDGEGRFDATVVGEWKVIAQLGDVVGEATVVIGHGALDRIVVGPVAPVVTADQRLQFKASGYDADGNPVPISPSWSASGGGDIAPDGTFDAVQAGEWEVEASVSGLTGTTTVLVEPGELSTIRVEPDDPTANVSDTLSFTARGFDAEGNEVAISPRWSVDGGGRVTGGGEFVAEEEGTWLVRATHGDVSGTVTVTILPSETQDGNPAPSTTSYLLVLIAVGAAILVMHAVLRRRPPLGS